MIKIKSYLFPILLIIFSLFAVKALFHPGFYTSHDGGHQIMRLVYFHQGLVDGQFPVRWAGNALDSYGYPLFIFTYRLPFWIAEIWYLLFHSLAGAIKFAFIASFVISSLTMYWLLLRLSKSKIAAFTGSMVYLWAPYRFVDIFVRAALGEAFTFIFAPLMFLGLFELSHSKKIKEQIKWGLVLALGITGMVLSHSMTLVLFIFPLLLWFLLWLLKSKSKLRYIGTTVVSGLLSLGLTAYYWFPAFYERKFTIVSDVLGAYYKDHFVTFTQLLRSTWLYGFSMPGTADDMMSFQVGYAQWGIAALAFTTILLFLVRSKLKSFITLGFQQLLILVYSLLVFGIAIMLMLPSGEPFFDFLSKVVAIDLPWKFLEVTTFSAALLITVIVQIITKKWLQTFCVIGIVALALVGNRHHLRVNQYTFMPDSDYFASTETSNQYEDYRPKEFDQNLSQKDPLVQVLSGQAQTSDVYNKSNQLSFTAQVASDGAKLGLKKAYYPGWQIKVDEQAQTLNQEQGRLVVSLNQGKHHVVAIFTNTSWRQVVDLVSLLTLLGVTFTVLILWLRKKQK
ncbi:hypothetical protein GYA49_06175 [Candidatus Beckwithbacteria bacterium]|nr:hypothetical protein [Candidatus Beckwithbacteria bacterium]